MQDSTTRLLFSRQSQGENRDQGSNSLSGILSTLIPTLIIAVIAVGFFLYFRTRSARVYRPRTDERLVQEEKRTPRSGVGFFSIIRNYNTLPDSYVLKHNSMDGYLWLRYFKVLIVISFAGCLVTWPILFPVNATGGGGQEQLDILSMSNIANPSRYFAHALVAVIFLGFVVLVVCRERLFFVGLRRAFYLSAAHAQRLSSRTLMVMGLPVEYMEEKALRQLFGANVRKVWIPTDCKSLEKDVKKQTKTALKLEGAEMSMIKKANAARIKAEKKKKAAPPADAEENAGPSQWLDDKKRPRHRLWPRFWNKVDTLNHCRGTLTELDRFVTQQQAEHLDLKHTKVPSAFIEFNSQAAAHEAYQTIGRESKMKFNPRYIGVQPEEVVWGNLGVSYASRKSKIILATIAVWVLIIFWAIPVAFVGILSNINYLTNKVPFLSFINDIPPVILGLVTSLLPVILLAVLMALVPIILRLLARLAGEPTQSAIELKTQSWYFAFQVVQVFLITTFTSSASATTTQIIANPSTAPALLAVNLPKASNFYISYFILFGLMEAALQLLNVVPLLMTTVLGPRFLDSTPRKRFHRFLQLATVGWGSTYPKFTLLGVIAITYACIAPLILGFATIGFSLLYIMFRYNWLFVFGNDVDTKGETYSRALKQLLTGVYLATICLIGLFAIGVSDNRISIGPLVIMIIFLVVVVVFQTLFDRAIAPMEQHLPLELLGGNEYSKILVEPSLEEQQLKEEHMETGSSSRQDSHATPLAETTKVEGEVPQPKTPPFNALSRRLEPFAQKHYEANKAIVPDAESEILLPAYTSEEYEHAYLNPAITGARPIIWLAKDKCGVSRLLVEQNKEAGLLSTDEGAEFDDKNKLVWNEENLQQAPIWERPVRY